MHSVNRRTHGRRAYRRSAVGRQGDLAPGGGEKTRAAGQQRWHGAAAKAGQQQLVVRQATQVHAIGGVDTDPAGSYFTQ